MKTINKNLVDLSGLVFKGTKAIMKELSEPGYYRINICVDHRETEKDYNDAKNYPEVVEWLNNHQNFVNFETERRKDPYKKIEEYPELENDYIEYDNLIKDSMLAHGKCYCGKPIDVNIDKVIIFGNEECGLQYIHTSDKGVFDHEWAQFDCIYKIWDSSLQKFDMTEDLYSNGMPIKDILDTLGKSYAKYSWFSEEAREDIKEWLAEHK